MSETWKKFQQSLHNHIKHKNGCPKCSYSKAEIIISYFLEKKGILHYPQYKFECCINPKTSRKLPFDFYLPTYNMCIEYDGEQHFKPFRLKDKKKSEKKLKEIKYRDGVKNELLRIDYTKFKQLKEILEKIFY